MYYSKSNVGSISENAVAKKMKELIVKRQRSDTEEESSEDESYNEASDEDSERDE